MRVFIVTKVQFRVVEKQRDHVAVVVFYMRVSLRPRVKTVFGIGRRTSFEMMPE